MKLWMDQRKKHRGSEKRKVKGRKIEKIMMVGNRERERKHLILKTVTKRMQ
jgi:hypothetical protein